MHIGRCCFCAELQSGKVAPEIELAYGVRERIIGGSENFCILPSVSPLAEGHLLVIPKVHVSSCAQLGRAMLDELRAVLNEWSRRLCAASGSVFMFEHGVGLGQIGGCGVDHAHWHLLPCDFDIACRVREKLEWTLGCGDPVPHLMEGLAAIGEASSYLLMMHSAEKCGWVFDGPIQSQLVRRIFANVLERDAWDWKILNGEVEFRAAIAKAVR